MMARPYHSLIDYYNSILSIIANCQIVHCMNAFSAVFGGILTFHKISIYCAQVLRYYQGRIEGKPWYYTTEQK